MTKQEFVTHYICNFYASWSARKTCYFLNKDEEIYWECDDDIPGLIPDTTPSVDYVLNLAKKHYDKVNRHVDLERLE